MNLLQKLEAEQAAGWPTPPDEWVDSIIRRILQLLTDAWLEAEDVNNPGGIHPAARRPHGYPQGVRRGQ